MKIAHIGDTHFKSKNLKNIKTAWELTIEEIISRNIDIIVHGGDVFDYFNIADRENPLAAPKENYVSFGTIFSSFASPLKKAIDKGISFIAIPGNHDIAGFGQKSALEPIAHFNSENVHLELNPSVIFHKGIAFACLPWLIIRERTELDTILNNMREELKKYSCLKILLAHCDLRGASEHHYSSVGGEFSLTIEDLELLGCDYGCLNHIHKRQYVLEDKYGKKYCYAGSLVQNNHGEEGHPTGFRVLEFE